MGQGTRDQAGSVDRLTEITLDTHCTIARRIMQCGDEVSATCVNRRKITPQMLGIVNSAIVDCMVDCIDILRGDKNNASVNDS